MANHSPVGNSPLGTRCSEVFSPERFDAVLFDLDGVLTSTARTHARCWKETFDDFLHTHSSRTGEPFHPFDLDADYKHFVDGKPRNDGVRSFLASRHITLPEGTADSPSEEVSINGLGNRKNQLVTQALQAGEAEAYPGSTAFVRWVRSHGLKTAVVSSSHHCLEVLRATGIADLFDARVDGEVADRWHLAGKPAPDTYLHAAKLLEVRPQRTAVVEDALAGVQAGRAGGFGLVIGVARGGNTDAFQESGADQVISDLGELVGPSNSGGGNVPS